jgi:hypothetical protein
MNPVQPVAPLAKPPTSKRARQACLRCYKQKLRVSANIRLSVGFLVAPNTNAKSSATMRGHVHFALDLLWSVKKI